MSLLPRSSEEPVYSQVLPRSGCAAWPSSLARRWAVREAPPAEVAAETRTCTRDVSPKAPGRSALVSLYTVVSSCKAKECDVPRYRVLECRRVSLHALLSVRIFLSSSPKPCCHGGQAARVQSMLQSRQRALLLSRGLHPLVRLYSRFEAFQVGGVLMKIGCAPPAAL